MKWILICVGAFAICFALGFILSKIIIKKKVKKYIFKTTILTLVIGLLLSIVCTFGYLGIYYKPNDEASISLQGDDNVNVSYIKNGYYFDGLGKNTALVFYPGAKVKCEAYSLIMLRLAQNGIDCFLVDMPFNFSLFGESKCESFLNCYNYDNWILSGHSMGGLVASNYVSKNASKVKGLVLLAAYPSNVIPDSVNLLSIYGTEDGCLEKDVYEENKINWPSNSTELIINGGNHAQFGDYGIQSKDGKASITHKEQWELTTNAIIDWVNNW